MPEEQEEEEEEPKSNPFELQLPTQFRDITLDVDERTSALDQIDAQIRQFKAQRLAEEKTKQYSFFPPAPNHARYCAL